MRISTFFYTLKQGIINIFRNKWFSLASIATIGACLFLFGLFYSVLMNVQSIVKTAQEGISVTVLFDDGISQERIEEIGSLIRKRPEVSDVRFTSADEAWESFKEEYLGEYSDGFTENPLENSASYEIYLSDVSMQPALVTYLEGVEGIRDVNRSEIVAATMTGVNALIAYISLGIIAILFAVSVFLISNTVTMGITVRREEIAIMKYIGAKDGFVRAPFVIEGLLIGIVGAIIPLIMLFFMYDKAVSYVMTKFSLLNNIITFLPVTTVYRTLLPVGVALGVGIGFIGSFFTIHKHLRV